MLQTWRKPSIAAPAVVYLGQGKGRDFIIGDRHGVKRPIVRALEAVNFDPAVDRLFSVGDLVDRGDFSAEALELLNQPWFFATLGNHEQMVLDLYADGSLDLDALRHHVARNGMAWWLSTPPEQQAALLDAFARLPLVMELNTVRGSVGILHAEVPVGMDWPTFIAQVEAGDRHTIKSALWGRVRTTNNDTSGVTGIDRVFAGHTPQFDGAMRLGNCYFIDTGAVFGEKGVAPGKLTMANVLCQTMVIDAREPTVLPLVDLFADEGQGRFGQYARPVRFR